MLTNEHLVEIKKRNEARTQGEWYIDEHALYDIVCDGHGTVLIAHDSGNAGDNVVANRKFAAHAPADITALLEEVECLREMEAQLEELKKYKEQRELDDREYYQLDRGDR